MVQENKKFTTSKRHNEEEESEPEETQQITQINRVLPHENDNYQLRDQTKHQRRISKPYHRYRFSGYNIAKQPGTLRPKRYQNGKRKISKMCTPEPHMR